MLVLSRKENESIVIGDDIVLTITQIQGNRIRLGIEAPKEVRVVRGELVCHDLAEVDKPSDPPSNVTPISRGFDNGCPSVAE